MTNEELILQKLDAMEAALTGELVSIKKTFGEIDRRFRDIDTYLDRHAHRQKILTDRADAQDKKIEALTEIVNRLAANSDNVIWKAKNQKAVGLNPLKVYDEFDKIGVPHIEGLRLLDAANRLLIDCDSKGNVHRTKKVRVSPTRTVNAVVIVIE